MSSFLKVLLWWSGGISAVALAFPDLIIIGLYLLVIPGLILSLAPAVFFYVALFSLFWFKGPFAGTWRAGSLGSLALAVVAIGVPTVLNLLATGALKVANARDKNPDAPFGPVATIAIQPADRYWGQDLCGDLCQLLLYNGVAQRVISLPPPPEPDKKSRSARNPTAFRIVKNLNCVDAKELISNDRGGNWLHGSRRTSATPQSIASAVRLRIASGECLVSEPVTDIRADLLIRRVDEVIGIKDQRFGFLPGPVSIRALELVAGDKVVARGSENKASKLIIPLFPAPRMRGVAVDGWEWARTSRYSEGYDVLGQLGRFTTFRLTTPDGADDKTLRATIDAALANPALPADHAAFGLLDDYYDLVREKGPIDGDAARLAKLISDERNTKFWFFPAWKLKDDAEKLTLLDPILNRLPQLISSDKPDSYKALEQLVGSLPDGALSAHDARVDALIADPVDRRRSPTLVKRLADRGPRAIEQLVAIMREGWAAPREIDGNRVYNYGDDAEAALSGLCRLAPAAKSALPKLRALAAAGIVPPGKLESDEWRSLLVALGADADEFDLPKDRKWKTDLYRDRLRRDAAKCGTDE